MALPVTVTVIGVGQQRPYEYPAQKISPIVVVVTAVTPVVMASKVVAISMASPVVRMMPGIVAVVVTTTRLHGNCSQRGNQNAKDSDRFHRLIPNQCSLNRTLCGASALGRKVVRQKG